LLLLVGVAVYVCGAGYNETRTSTTTFTFLRGDSTVTDTAETSYVDLNIPTGNYRFNKLTYQADVAWGGMANCSAFVMLEQGPGSDVAPFDSIQTFVITGDSLYSTGGYDLVYTWSADSAKPHVRLRVIVRTDDDDTGASAGEKVDSSYTINHTIEAWGHD